MKLPTMTRYGLRAMVELAAGSDAAPVSAATIAERQKLSLKYLERIMSRLRQAGLVVARPARGYVLTRPPEELTVATIVAALEDGRGLTRCLCQNGSCDMLDDCPTRDLWNELDAIIAAKLESVRLADLVHTRDNTATSARR